MLVNVSYNNPEVTKKINAMVGEPFGIIERFKRKGIGSRRGVIVEASLQIEREFHGTGNVRYCTIELRPKGILIHFRKRLEAMAWVVPFHQLSIFQNGDNFSLHAAGEFVRIGKFNSQSPDFGFLKKIGNQKHHYQTETLIRVDDLSL